MKPSNFHFKNKKHRNSLKIMNFCVFISGLKIEFLPRHFAVYWLISVIVLVVEVESQVLLQLVAGQFLAVQVSLVHVNGVNLCVGHKRKY
ncbi:hypothetical protein HMPREF3209_01245 [Lactobacillus crispatus]|nr:hypothetical protein HMPREF3209_01245 [Lactobacillus crispatus]